MTSYEVIIMPQARKDLDAFSGKLISRFEEVIMGFSEEPRPRNSKKLSGGGARWRVRVGEYRILYEIDDPRTTVKIFRIAHRKEVYR